LVEISVASPGQIRCPCGLVVMDGVNSSLRFFRPPPLTTHDRAVCVWCSHSRVAVRTKARGVWIASGSEGSALPLLMSRKLEFGASGV